MRERLHRRVRPGPGRVLALAYAFFTLAAGARSGVQLTSHPHQALLAYLLSAVAAAIYATGAVLMLCAEGGHLRRVAVATCVIELTGVCVVGTLSVLRPLLFGDQSVWSGYGSGYAFVPLALPLLALAWLHRPLTRESPEPSTPPTRLPSDRSPS